MKDKFGTDSDTTIPANNVVLNNVKSISSVVNMNEDGRVNTENQNNLNKIDQIKVMKTGKQQDKNIMCASSEDIQHHRS